MDWTVFANNLKKYRKDNKLTQDDLAKRLNVSRSAISYYEKGSVEPSIFFLINLANEMNCSIDNLFGFNREVTIDLPQNLTKEDLKPLEKEFNDPKYYLDKLKKTLTKVQRSYIELEMSKKRTDRMYDELLRTFNREERFKEMLDELTDLENKFNYKFEFKNIEKNDVEVADELVPSIEDLRNEKLKKWETKYKKNKDYKNIICINKYGKVAAGIPSFACEDVEKLLYLPQKYFSPAYDYFALTINGDSMNELYEDGEVIIVRKQNYARNGDIIIACISGEATCKEYYFNKDNNKNELIPHSTNPKHKPQFYSNDEIIILGIVECSLNKILDKK